MMMKMIYNINNYILSKIAAEARTSKKRGIVCVPAEHPRNLSHIDRFPINKKSEVRKTLLRLEGLSEPPKWWSDDLSKLKQLIMDTINKYYLIKEQNGKLLIDKK